MCKVAGNLGEIEVLKVAQEGSIKSLYIFASKVAPVKNYIVL